MSEMRPHSLPNPRRGSAPLITILAVLTLFGLFWLLVYKVYLPSRPAAAPHNARAENLSKDLDWKATPITRRQTLTALRATQTEQGATYAWADKKTGTVQLPITVAMQLTLKEIAARK